MTCVWTVIRWSVLCVGLVLSLSDSQLAELRRKCGVRAETESRLSLQFQNQFELSLGLDYLFNSSIIRPFQLDPTRKMNP